MCALQMQAEAGPTILESPEGLEPYMEKFVVKQVLSLPALHTAHCQHRATSLQAYLLALAILSRSPLR